MAPAYHTGPLTRAGLDRMPDDGHRYELIDGVLIGTPSPVFRARLTLPFEVEVTPAELTL